MAGLSVRREGRGAGTPAQLSGWRWLAAAMLVIVAGCATQAPRETDIGTDWNARQQWLVSIEDWFLEGRIAVSAGGEGWSGTLSWRQMDDELDFRFRGPFGIGGFRIHGDPDRLRVKTTTGTVFYMSDPEEDLRSRFGWSIPVHSMRYWMLGVPDPAEHAEETLADGGGLLLGFEQRGWHVSYDGYRDVDGTALPRKLVMEGDDVRIRVAVDRWTIDD